MVSISAASAVKHPGQLKGIVQVSGAVTLRPSRLSRQLLSVKTRRPFGAIPSKGRESWRVGRDDTIETTHGPASTIRFLLHRLARKIDESLSLRRAQSSDSCVTPPATEPRSEPLRRHVPDDRGRSSATSGRIVDGSLAKVGYKGKGNRVPNYNLSYLATQPGNFGNNDPRNRRRGTRGLARPAEPGRAGPHRPARPPRSRDRVRQRGTRPLRSRRPRHGDHSDADIGCGAQGRVKSARVTPARPAGTRWSQAC